MTHRTKIPAAGSGASARTVESLILIGIVLFGICLTVWRYHQVDARMRESLLERTTLISWALRADHIASLHGSERDLATPLYAMIKEQLTEARTLHPCIRFIYVMRRDASARVVFLVDSEPAVSADYSPPGQVYEEAVADVHRVFDRGQPVTVGPMVDRWGTWLSAFVPLFHPHNNALVGVLGVDIDASQWRLDKMRGAMPPIVATMVLLGLALVFFRLRRLSETRTLLWRWEVIVASVFGFVLTVALSLAINENELWKHNQAFRRVATVQASSLQQLLFRLGDNYLEGVGRFFDGSNFVDREEFRQYIGYLLSRPYARSWLWVVAVMPGEREGFVSAVRANGMDGYEVWSLDGGRRRTISDTGSLHYAVCYVQPQGEKNAWVGYDLATEPAFRMAIEGARNTGMLTASPADFYPGLGDGLMSVVFRPVFHHGEPGRLSGLAASVIDMQVLLQRALSRESASSDPISYVEFYELLPDREPVFLAASDGSTRKGHLLSATRDKRGIDGLMAFSAPVFAFGRTYAAVALPEAGFLNLHPAREGWRAFAMGIALTVLGSTLIGLLATRRARLEQQVAERTSALRRSEESYRGLFNAIQQSIYIQDAQGCFVDVNEGAVTRYGYAREEFIGRTPGFLAAPGRNDMAMVERCFRDAWAGHPQYFEFWGRTKSGEEFPKEVWLCKGTYLGQDVVIAMASDISDRKRSDEENRRLQSQLLQSQKMESIGRLAGGVAHDFNNMLQAIIGNANLAKMETPPGSALADFLTEIELSAHRSARLTRQLLAFASKQTVQPRILDLNDTVAGMLKMLQRLIGENIQLNWKPGPNLWPVKIDPGQIDQILANLAVNARDAIRDTGHIEIATENYVCNPDECHRSCTRCRPCRYVVIQVRDDGCGMTDEVRQHLFEPFFTTKEPGKGTGLGLATVFGIVHQNDGVIEVDSTPGVGSTFRIMLPMIDTHQVPQPAAPEAQDTLSGRETVLLVEDEAVILNMGMVSLQRLGYTVLVAATPTTAMRIARDYPDAINLLITDVILPDLDGLELARRVRELRPDIRCLFMSGYTADVISDRGVLDESVHFIQKPFTIAALATKIREVIEARD